MLTKSLGQNFLARRQSAPSNCRRGRISKARQDPRNPSWPRTLRRTLLLEQAGHVFAIEKTTGFTNCSRKACEQQAFELLHADALDYVKTIESGSDWKLVSNLPLFGRVADPRRTGAITTPPTRIVATLANRSSATDLCRADSDDYGLLTLVAPASFTSRTIGSKFRRRVSFPAPDVDSACITLVRRTHHCLPPDLHSAPSRKSLSELSRNDAK